MSPVVLLLGISNAEIEYDLPIDIDCILESYNFGVGKFFADNTLVGVKYEHWKNTIKIPSLLIDDTTENDDYELSFKSVKKLEYDTAVNVEGSYTKSYFDDGTDDGSNTITAISGDYYFNKTTSIGAGLKINTGDDNSDEGKTLAININLFVSPRTSFKFSYETFSADNDKGTDHNNLDFTFSVRF